MAYITGYGVCIPGNIGSKKLLNNLLEKKSPLAKFLFDNIEIYTSKFSDQEINNIALEYKDQLSFFPGCEPKIAFLLKALEEALYMANLSLEALNNLRVKIVFSTCQVSLEKVENIAKDAIFSFNKLNDSSFLGAQYSYLPKLLMKYLNIDSDILSFSSACAASNNAIGYAMDIIRYEQNIDLVLIMSIDTYSTTTTAGFYSLGAYSKDLTSPFGSRTGLNLGEGEAVLILENNNRLNKQQLENKWSICGYSLSGDAYHITAPSVDGDGAQRAMVGAIEDSGLLLENIDYIKTHGTGTDANDISESNAILNVFGKSTPSSSLKSFFGHTLGSSGIIETIATILLVDYGVMPPNYNFLQKRDQVKDINILDSNFNYCEVKNFIANSFAFGGNNSACVYSKNYVFNKKPLFIDKVYINDSGMAVFNISNNKDIFDFIDGDKVNTPAERYFSRFNFSATMMKYGRASKQAKLMLKSLENIVNNNTHISNNVMSGIVGGVLSSSAEVNAKYMESVFRERPTFASAYYFPMTAVNTVSGVSSIAYKITGYNTNLLGGISAFLYSHNLISCGRQNSVIVSASDDINDTLLKIYEKASWYSSSPVTAFSNKNTLYFNDMAASILLSNSPSESSVAVIAIETRNIFLQSNSNTYLNVIKNILEKQNLSYINLDLVVASGVGIDKAFFLEDEALTEIFSNHPVVVSTNNVFGYNFSTPFLTSVWFAQQVLINQYVPNIMKANTKKYVLSNTKYLKKDSIIMLLQTDITGNLICMLLKKGV